MPESPSHRTRFVVLSVALGAALLMIAFLLGRESARAPVSSAAEVPAAPALETPVAAVSDESEERRWPKWADLDASEDVEDPNAIEPAGQIEEKPDGTVLLSNRGGATDTPEVNMDSPANEHASSVQDYFLRMDVVHSESGAGDPDTFAMDLIKAGLGGSTSGFDQLIADTQRMEQEIRDVTAPPACGGYHEANLKALAESREILEEMKTAFARRDFSRLTAIAQQARTLQVKAKALQEMRERLIADAAR